MNLIKYLKEYTDSFPWAEYFVKKIKIILSLYREHIIRFCSLQHDNVSPYNSINKTLHIFSKQFTVLEMVSGFVVFNFGFLWFCVKIIKSQNAIKFILVFFEKELIAPLIWTFQYSSKTNQTPETTRNFFVRKKVST